MTDSEIDVIFEKIDNLFWSGKFDEVDRIISSIKLTNQEEVVTYLTAAFGGKHKLLNYDRLLDAAKEKWGNEDHMFDGFDQK